MKFKIPKNLKSWCLPLGLGLSLGSWPAAAPLLAATDMSELQFDAIAVKKTDGKCGTKTSEGLVFQDAFKALSCEFHTVDWTLPASSTTASLAELDRLTDETRRLQQIGAKPSAQAFLEIAEGLWQCRKARALQNAIRTSPEAKETFCEARQQSLMALSNVPWQLARFRYLEGLPFDSSHFIDKVAQCYAETGPLNEKRDADCRKSASISDTAADEIADQAYATAHSLYLGASGPISKMFMDKQKIAIKIVARLDDKLKPLLDKADALNQKLTLLQTEFKDLKDPKQPNGPVDTLVAGYQSNFSRMAALLNRLDSWEKNLLMETHANGTQTNHLDHLVSDKETSAKSQLKDRHGNFLGTGTGPRAFDGLDAVFTQLQGAPLLRSKAAKKLCTLYYCQLAAGPGAETPYTRACQSTRLSVTEPNPLCHELGLPLIGGPDDGSVKAYCEAVGFNVSFAVIGMNSARSRTCMKAGA